MADYNIKEKIKTDKFNKKQSVIKNLVETAGIEPASANPLLEGLHA